LLMCGTVLLKNASLIPSLLQRIFSEAFSLKAFGSGSVGSVLYHAMRVGFSKGLITNEAGCGTAPIAHASAVSTDAVKQGFLGIVEVFFDTVILCTASGLVLLTAIDKYPTQNGFALVTAAFSGVFGKLGEILLALSIFFFVIATLVGWSYYGKTALEFLTPNKKIGTAYLILFSLTAIWGVIGAENRFWALSDITLGLMTFINTGYLVFFRNDIRKATDKFFLYTKRSALGQKPKADRKS
ncbi:MAG: alanine:cation symporter family protein, partial [Clostridia bacterium]|nr:alanine:cation symporter family protein [Clostridia bacterium]